MTRIQQVHWELEMDYIGHPYYVSGNAILHALGQQLPAEMLGTLQASHGMFVPGQYGTYPEEHSQSGSHPTLGNGLSEVAAYEDLFLFRNPAQRWLIDTRPRDAVNAHALRPQRGHPALASETIVGLPEGHRFDTRPTRWFVSAYLHATDGEVLPIGDDSLDGLQFGGKRNYGYGTTELVDTQLVDLDALDYSTLEACTTFELELLTPFVLESAYPNANDQSVPWWWTETRDDLREREERIVEQREMYRLRTVDHGQIVSYDGDTPVETAKNGVCRVGTHSRYGFGEFRLVPLD